ncbi:hypothetical protein U0021_09565 [Moraxella canis]|uniref:Cytochrome c domain-containing protein n=1 Tax=Moraxella canis TaxID=90239 RepID=A0ABZ0WXH7_9GAMM|nr:hypothetical protein [Moraxella canis]WQE03962.1 hypothetical protein U0021_09565 [Moraxella canis]
MSCNPCHNLAMGSTGKRIICRLHFHDGQVNSLEEAVQIMGKIQLNKQFTNEETADIVAFLRTLTGDQPNIKLPMLPPSNASTPLPNPFGE